MRVPNPAEVFGMAKSTVGWASEQAAAVASAPARVLGLIDDVQALVARVESVIERAEKAVEGAEGTVAQARAVADEAELAVVEARRTAAEAAGVVGGAKVVAEEASKTVVSAQESAAGAAGLLELYRPAAERGAPLLNRFVSEFSESEVDAAIKLVDELPVLTEHVRRDVIPILATLDRVGPEIHQLLEVTSDVRRALLGLPGFGYFKRRGSSRATEEQPSEPLEESATH